MDMNLNNINGKYYTQAFSARGQKIEEMIEDNKLAKDSKNLALALGNTAERYIPEHGKFAPFYLGFAIPDTQNETKYIIESDPTDPAVRRLAVGVKKKASDALEKEYLFKGSKQELISFLKDKNNGELFYQTVKELSDSVEGRNF